MRTTDRARSRSQMDRWSEDRLQQYQLRALRHVLTYAYQELPFYRRRFDQAGFTPRALRSLADLARVPVFTKKDVLDALRQERRFPAGLEKLDAAGNGVLCMTSGTLGTAFLYLSKKWAAIRGNSLARAYRWAGLRRGMRMLMAAPAWHSLAVQETRVVRRIGATCVIPWGTFLPQYAPYFLNAILDVKPAFISIFLPMLYALLAECRRRAMRLADAFKNVEFVLVVGAPMTPRSRAMLKKELGVRDIFEGLGNPEGLTAMECSFHTGHHIFLDCCFVEILEPKTGRPLPAGRRGNVVITTLIPHGSLYIRYDTEDLGMILPGRCKCRRSWPLMEVYDRRANIVRIAGQEIVPYDIRRCLDEVPELVNIPFAVVRSEKDTDNLKLLIQQPAGGDPKQIGVRLKKIVQKQFSFAVTEEWAEELPQRWKGVTVIEEKDWRAAHG
jgi:phenylacetate-CoA ligase